MRTEYLGMGVQSTWDGSTWDGRNLLHRISEKQCEKPTWSRSKMARFVSKKHSVSSWSAGVMTAILFTNLVARNEDCD